MTGNTNYVIIGLSVLIFLFQLIIIWYVWWFYNQMNNDFNDINDMTIDIYNLVVIDANANGRDADLQIPKRSKDSYLERHKLVDQEC